MQGITDVELRCRSFGLPVKELVPTAPFLHVQLGIAPVPNSGSSVYKLDVTFNQPAAVTSNGAIAIVTTWQTASFGSVGNSNVAGLHPIILQQLDRFINAFLSKNPLNK